MSDLFIPPEGSMQFVFDKYPNYPLWISGTPEITDFRRPDCPHRSGYLVLNPPLWLHTVEDDCDPYVCECWGRIIE